MASPSAACAASPCRRIPRRGITLGEPRVEPLASLDCLLMRKDPPFDMEYIYTTYILERAEAAGVLVLNRPQGLRDMNEKVYTAWFPQCCAPTLVTRDMGEMQAFLREHGRIVVKPLHGMGGRSIFVVAPRRQEHERDLRDADRLWPAIRHRAALHPGDRRKRRCARAAGGRRARALRAGAHSDRRGQPRQPRRRRQGRGPAADRSRAMGGEARSARRWPARACSSWAWT